MILPNVRFSFDAVAKALSVGWVRVCSETIKKVLIDVHII